MDYNQIKIDACNYCTQVILINIMLLSNSDKEQLLGEKKVLLDEIKQKLEKTQVFHGNINNDDEVNEFLFGIYTEKLDSDKYGVKMWGRKNGRHKSKHDRKTVTRQSEAVLQ